MRFVLNVKDNEEIYSLCTELREATDNAKRIYDNHTKQLEKIKKDQNERREAFWKKIEPMLLEKKLITKEEANECNFIYNTEAEQILLEDKDSGSDLGEILRRLTRK